jgi:acetyltransferase-like isoleucine patch superfamily enzyme
MLRKLLWALNAIKYRFLGAHIGFMSYIGPVIFLKGIKNIYTGKKVRIFPGARMETHNNGIIRIGEDVSIGQNFHITASVSELVVGARTTISGNVFITNIDHDYMELETHVMKQAFIVKETRIGENCFIGYGAAIQAGTVLGKQCVVGTNSVVRGTYPDRCVIVGAPARIVKRYRDQTGKWEKTNKDGEFLDGGA